MILVGIAILFAVAIAWYLSTEYRLIRRQVSDDGETHWFLVNKDEFPKDSARNKKGE